MSAYFADLQGLTVTVSLIARFRVGGNEVERRIEHQVALNEGGLPTILGSGALGLLAKDATARLIDVCVDRIPEHQERLEKYGP